MLLAAAKYGYLNAKVRSLRSDRLSEQDHHFLLAAKDLRTALSYLATTSYSTCLTDSGQVLPQMQYLERQLARPVLDHYTKITLSVRGAKERQVLRALFSRFESENMKIVLRSLFGGLSREYVSHLLFPLGRLSTLDWESLWVCRSVRALVEHLKPNPFGQPLRHALPQFEAQGRLFPLEMALDFSCFRLIWRSIHALTCRADRSVMQRVLALYIDILNILWVIRIKIDFGLAPEEVINYTLPEGNLITLAHINRLSRSSDIEGFIKALPAVLQTELAGIQEWQAVGRRLEGYFLKILARVFSGQPFHLGIPVAYLLEKEIELANLITVLQSKANDLSVEETWSRVSWQFVESQHVPAG